MNIFYLVAFVALQCGLHQVGAAREHHNDLNHLEHPRAKTENEWINNHTSGPKYTPEPGVRFSLVAERTEVCEKESIVKNPSQTPRRETRLTSRRIHLLTHITLNSIMAQRAQHTSTVEYQVEEEPAPAGATAATAAPAAPSAASATPPVMGTPVEGAPHPS